MYTILKEDSFVRDLKNVKDEKSKINIKNKILEIANTLEINPNHYKNLRKPLQRYKRVHVNNSFVIIFTVDIHHKYVIFNYYRHHDDVYNI
ncbi:MAG: addiction module toxin RelE [Methanobrevibacter sp.]|nr:addiction module toxin RelE [Methanobrevibacter sp.]